MEDSSTQSWERIASDWIRHADANDYRNEFLIPTMISLLGNVSGSAIIDIGCGEGGYARILARKGAKVIGVDGAVTLIKTAIERASDEGLSVDFRVLNANSLIGIASDSFDICIAAMSLMDIEDYRGVVAEIHRVVKHGGRLVMSMLHPCFTEHGARWIRNEQGESLYYAVDNYFKRDIWEDKITPEFRHPAIFRHRSLQECVNPFIDAGFILRRIVEPVPDSEVVQNSPRLKQLQRIPYFLFMEWENGRA
jgi:2-polyprenyl-3-methyl-5-hydroxy-6-metoxy-1,4-benzoquinol methylase